MSGVFISIGARAAVVIREFVRDGKAPVAELQNRLAETIGHGVIAHTKQIFSRYSPIPSIPASAGSSRTRWRFAFHSGPYARLIGVRMELAPQDDGLGATDPYAQLDIALATAPTVTVGTANVHYGSSYGAYDDVPWNFGGGVRYLDDGTGGLGWLLPDTEYVGTFYDYDHARLFGATVFEVSLEPDTDDGFPRANHGAGGSILDIDRQSASSMTRQLWARSAAMLWSGGSESNSTARSIVSDSTSGILSKSIGTFGLTATGTVAVQGALSQSIGNFNLSAQGEVDGAPPNYQAQSSYTGSNTSTSTSWPTHAENDIGILIVGSYGTASGVTSPSAPSGWSTLSSNYYVVDGEVDTYRMVTIFYKRATSSGESSATVNAPGSASYITTVMLTFRNCVTSGSPFDLDYGNVTDPADTAVLVDALSISGVNRLSVAVMCHETSGTVSSWAAGTMTVTERFDGTLFDSLVSGADIGIAVSDAATNSGTQGSFTATLSSSSRQAALWFALKPI